MSRLLMIDTQMNTDTVNACLARRGHFTQCAPSGAEALERARQARPEAVITDTRMPAGEGLAFCRAWKGDETLRDIPLVFLAPPTADRHQEVRALELGADRFLRQPARPDAAAATIETLIGKGRGEPDPPGCRSADHFLWFIENMDDAAYESDTEGNLTYANKAAARLLGVSRNEMVGQSFLPLIAETNHERAVEVFLQTLSGQRVEYELTMVNGIIGHFKNTPQKDNDGNVVGVFGTARDISRQKMAEKKLMEAKAAAEATSRAKSEFLSGMSHELRTPLNAVIGFSQVLSDQHFGALNKKQAEYVGNIHRSGTHLLGLIDKILDLTRLESEKTVPALQPVRMASLIEDEVGRIRTRAEAAGIRVETAVSAELAGVSVMADPALFRQVLANLLANAVQFTPAGGAVHLESTLQPRSFAPEDRSGAEKELRIEVRDTGIGLDPEELETIFDPFFQSEAGRGGKTPGTGLGLALARRIMVMHGGRIWAESPGKKQGSRLILCLPAPAETE